MAAPSFSKSTPNKISDFINVSGKNILIKTENNGGHRVAIADDPIDAKVDGKKLFCVRVDHTRAYSQLMIGFTPMETFDSTKSTGFGSNRFTGCGILLCNGNLYYAVGKYHNIIDKEISQNAKELIVILSISNNGKKKEIRFLCDGKESKCSDVSKYLKEDQLFPAICLWEKNQQVTAIPIDQIENKTPAVERLIFEGNNNSVVEVETKKENTKEKTAKQVATKKTKKETKPKTTKATKKKTEKNNNIKEKKTKAKK
jgi:hypothetical protein